jgi:hypothetical protein
MAILAIGDRAWGKGETIPLALGNMIKAGGSRRCYILYIVHPDSYVTEMGDIAFPGEHPPKEIHRVGTKKVKPGTRSGKKQ